MKARVIVGVYCRHKNTPTYGWARVLEIIKPHKGVNTHSYPIAKCEWGVDKNALVGLIKYFKVSDLLGQ